jgi:hypothetical protein
LHHLVPGNVEAEKSWGFKFPATLSSCGSSCCEQQSVGFTGSGSIHKPSFVGNNGSKIAKAVSRIRSIHNEIQVRKEKELSLKHRSQIDRNPSFHWKILFLVV